jgi:cytoskeletal protein CcmA (bactofilin family)
MRLGKLVLLLLPVFLTPAVLTGSEFLTQDGAILSGSETIDDDLYVFGNYAEIYGNVKGDLTAFCYDIETGGKISGNANILAFNVEMEGDVGNSVRVLANNLSITGTIGRNILGFGRKINVNRRALVLKDITCAGDDVRINGTVVGNVDISGGIVTISGKIDGDVRIVADEISIEHPAVIGGELRYTSKEKAFIEDGVTIIGQTIWQLPDAEREADGGISALCYVIKLVLFIMTFFTGLILILLFRNHTYESTLQVEKKFWSTLAIGLLTLIVIAGGSLILLILIIGIPLSVMLMGLGLVLFYIGKIYVSIVIGRMIFRIFLGGKKVALGWELLVGLIVLSIIFQIPYFGTFIYLVAFILGAGAAIAGYLSLNRRLREAAEVSSS